MRRLYAPHRLDISTAEIASALASSTSPGDAHRVERLMSPAIATLSVRSAFDLLLEALAFPEGSQLVMSAVTVPDMERVARAHRLTVAPVEVELGSLAPDPDALQRAVGPNTRAIVVAHLFGGRMDLGPTLEIARRAGVPVIEDCAQAFVGPEVGGHPEALASMFSFGAIKTSTALGGAVTQVRDDAVLSRMRALHSLWPRQTPAAYAVRVARLLAIGWTRDPLAFALAQQACAAVGVDFQQRLGETLKGFPGGPMAMLAGIRRQPSGGMLTLLARRLEQFDVLRLRRRAANGERVLAAVGARLPGRLQPVRTHWLVPVLAAAPDEMIRSLRAQGFAAQRSTSLGVIGAVGSSWLSRVVFLPAYPEIAPADFDRLIDLAAGVTDPESEPDGNFGETLGAQCGSRD
jgi:perosamine synthetase